MFKTRHAIIIGAVLLIIIAAIFTVKLEYDRDIRLYINEEEINMYNMVVRHPDDFQVPIMYILNHQKIGYSQADHNFIMQTDPKVIFTTDKNKAFTNDEEEKMDCYFIKKEDHFLVSLNYLSEKLGYTYEYDTANSIIYMTKK